MEEYRLLEGKNGGEILMVSNELWRKEYLRGNKNQALCEVSIHGGGIWLY